MGSAERGRRRDLALAAGADWRAENLPAASQGGARRAIFRGLYKGPGRRGPAGSASARDGEGPGDDRSGTGTPGRPGSAEHRPPTRA